MVGVTNKALAIWLFLFCLWVGLCGCSKTKCARRARKSTTFLAGSKALEIGRDRGLSMEGIGGLQGKDNFLWVVFMGIGLPVLCEKRQISIKQAEQSEQITNTH